MGDNAGTNISKHDEIYNRKEKWGQKDHNADPVNRLSAHDHVTDFIQGL